MQVCVLGVLEYCRLELFYLSLLGGRLKELTAQSVYFVHI